MDGYEEQRDQIKFEASKVLDLFSTFESKKKALDIQKESCSDEVQVKQVLMSRIKELESQQDNFTHGKFETDKLIMMSQQRQLDLLGQIKIVDDNIQNVSLRLNHVEGQKKESVTETMRKELNYKSEQLKSESERNYLKQEAEELKKKLIGMVKVLESRDNQMTKIDQKIEELIRLRQELTSTKENDLNSLLNF